MIGILVDGADDFLQTERDTSITIKLENPVFGDAETLSPGSYSFPFNLPGGSRSPKNASILNHPDLIEARNSYYKVQAKLFYDGVFFKAGHLKSKSANNETISNNFGFGLNTLSPDLKKAKIRDIISQSFVISEGGFRKGIYLKKSGADVATIEINGQQYTDDTLSGISTLINNYYDANMVIDQNVFLPRSVLVAAGPNTPMGKSPTYLEISMATTITDSISSLPTLSFSTDPFITFNIKIDQEFLGSWIVEAFDMDSYYDAFDSFISGYRTGAYPNSAIRFPVLFNADLHTDLIKTYDVINGYHSTGLVRNDPNAGAFTVRNYNSIQPFVLLKHVLDAIALQFDFQYEGDFYEDEALESMLIDNSQTLDQPMEYLGSNKFIFWRQSFNINELVPDMTVLEFLKAVAGRYNLAVYYNDRTNRVRLQTRESIASAKPYDDVTAISSPSSGVEDLRYEGYKLTVKKEDSDAFSVDESSSPDGEVEHKIECGRIQRTKTDFAYAGGGFFAGPYVSRKNGEKFGFRIFHYKGIVSTGVFNYPQADIHGLTINESFLDFPNNLVIKYWLYWLQFEMNRRSVRVKIKFPLRKLVRFDYELKRRFDRTDYLVKSMDVRLTNTSVEVTDVELYTMKL